MNSWMILREALSALGQNRLRTALTGLGMMIGVAAVVLMMAIGQGAKSSVNETIASMGSNLFVVLSGASTTGGVRMGSGTTPTLTLGDAEALRQLPGMAAVAPFVSGSGQLVAGSNNWSSPTYGVTPAFFQVRNWDVSQGSLFGYPEVRTGARVALLGKVSAQNLFGEQDPVGKYVRIKNRPFLIVGVLAEKGQTLDGRDQDDVVVIPLTTAQRQLFGNQFPETVRQMLVQAQDATSMAGLETDMNALLRQRHKLGENVESDFTVRNLTALFEASAAATQTMSLLLGAIASVSLLVGGIGIMNIMLVSVSERTREIGIRMAIGASRRDILRQFLLEALVICLLGGLIGVGLGVGGAWLVSLTDTMVEVSSRSILLAFTFSAAVGLFFGWYPARRAANLRPIEALRHD